MKKISNPIIVTFIINIIALLMIPSMIIFKTDICMFIALALVFISIISFIITRIVNKNKLISGKALLLNGFIITIVGIMSLICVYSHLKSMNYYPGHVYTPLNGAYKCLEGDNAPGRKEGFFGFNLNSDERSNFSLNLGNSTYGSYRVEESKDNYYYSRTKKYVLYLTYEEESASSSYNRHKVNYQKTFDVTKEGFFNPTFRFKERNGSISFTCKYKSGFLE